MYISFVLRKVLTLSREKKLKKKKGAIRMISVNLFRSQQAGKKGCMEFTQSS